MRAGLKSLWYSEEGQNLTEYALLLMLIVLVAFAAARNVASTISNVYSNISTGTPALSTGMAISATDAYSNSNALAAGT